jgi:hypothetical protein
MDVVGRQAAPTPALHSRFPQLFRQPVDIDLLVAVLEEDRLAPVASRRDVMGESRDDNAGETGHRAPEYISNIKGTLLPSPETSMASSGKMFAI